MSILNIGTRALMANQLALQTAGNNVANVNTPGHSKQTVVLESVEGAFLGCGLLRQTASTPPRWFARTTNS